jgi:hypothetical protein
MHHSALQSAVIGTVRVLGVIRENFNYSLARIYFRCGSAAFKVESFLKLNIIIYNNCSRREQKS